MNETNEPYGAHETPSTQCMPDQALDGGDEAIGDSTNCFPGSSRVTSKGNLSVTFLVDEKIVPMKIQKIPVIY
jgi:hypothetical protein